MQSVLMAASIFESKHRNEVDKQMKMIATCSLIKIIHWGAYLWWRKKKRLTKRKNCASVQCTFSTMEAVSFISIIFFK